MPARRRVTQLKSFEGRRFLTGSRRCRFQPETRSRSSRSSSSSSRGISLGSSWRSPSMVMISRPCEKSKPAESAAALPKLRRSRTSLTRGSRSCAARTSAAVPSREPSSTKTTSNERPSSPRTRATRSASSRTVAASLRTGTSTLILSDWTAGWVPALAGSPSATGWMLLLSGRATRADCNRRSAGSRGRRPAAHGIASAAHEAASRAVRAARKPSGAGGSSGARRAGGEDLLGGGPAAAHRVIHVEVLPLAEAADVPDAVRAQPGADHRDVFGVGEVVDHVGGRDLLGVDELDAVVGPQDPGGAQAGERGLDRRLAVERAPAGERHLGGDRALARRYGVGAEGGR